MDDKAVNDFIDLTIKAAQARGDMEVPRESIKKALELIESGEKEVMFYPTGLPSVRDAYIVALGLTSQN